MSANRQEEKEKNVYSLLACTGFAARSYCHGAQKTLKLLPLVARGRKSGFTAQSGCIPAQLRERIKCTSRAKS